VEVLRTKGKKPAVELSGDWARGKGAGFAKKHTVPESLAIGKGKDHESYSEVSREELLESRTRERTGANQPKPRPQNCEEKNLVRQS